MNEKDKMMLGQWYDANNNKQLLDERMKTMDLCFELNQLKPSEKDKRDILLKQILGYEAENLTLLSPFVCDYGKHIQLGKNVFININSYFMDGASITIGNNVFIGPSCGFYTAKHPIDYETRNQGLEQALPIHIGNNVWIGANVVVLAGVHIGDGSVIAAGSVVTHDIEANVVASGIPCKKKNKLKSNED